MNQVDSLFVHNQKLSRAAAKGIGRQLPEVVI